MHGATSHVISLEGFVLDCNLDGHEYAEKDNPTYKAGAVIEWCDNGTLEERLTQVCVRARARARGFVGVSAPRERIVSPFLPRNLSTGHAHRRA